MGTMAERDHAPAPDSTNLTLTVDGKASTLSVAELQAMPEKNVTVHK
jgi:ribosomal protein L25 (general stress protein Ctc)